MCIKSDAKNGQQYQKWLFAVSEMLSKIGIGFISIFLLKARVLYLTILKRKNLSLPFKGCNRVCHLFGFTRVSFCQNLLHFTLGQWSESWRRWCRVSFPLFLSFFASFKNSSEKKVRKIVFGLWLVDRISVCIHYCREIDNIFPALTMATMAARAKKKQNKTPAKRFAHAISVHYRDFEHSCVYWKWLRGSSFSVIMFALHT